MPENSFFRITFFGWKNVANVTLLTISTRNNYVATNLLAQNQFFCTKNDHFIQLIGLITSKHLYIFPYFLTLRGTQLSSFARPIIGVALCYDIRRNKQKLMEKKKKKRNKTAANDFINSLHSQTNKCASENGHILASTQWWRDG